MGTLRNVKHERFAQGCAMLFPPAVAYKHAGYSDKFPGNGAKLFRDPRIQARIRELRANDEVDISYRRALLRRELDCIGLFRLLDILVADEDGNEHLRPLSELNDEQRAAISEISLDADGKWRVKAHSKIAAIEQLIKLDGLAEPDKLEVSWDLSRLSDDELKQYETLARKAAVAGAD